MLVCCIIMRTACSSDICRTSMILDKSYGGTEINDKTEHVTQRQMFLYSVPDTSILWVCIIFIWHIWADLLNITFLSICNGWINVGIMTLAIFQSRSFDRLKRYCYYWKTIIKIITICIAPFIKGMQIFLLSFFRIFFNILLHYNKHTWMMTCTCNVIN